MKRLILFPFNGNAREALDAASGEFEVIAFVDDDPSKHGEYKGISVSGREILADLDEQTYLLAVPGSINTHSKLDKIIASLEISDDRWARVIHPDASVSKYAKVGRNVLIMAGTVITSDATIGDHCCILPNCVVHHDAEVSDYCTLAAGVLIAGFCKIGQRSYLGAGARIKDHVEIGENCVIGMGANVLQNFGESITLVGNPARALEK